MHEWRTKGWLKLGGVLSARTVDDLGRWTDEVAAWSALGGPGLHHFEQTDRGPALARSERFVDAHPSLCAFARGDRLAAVLGQLLGEPPVLFKEKINYKQPGGAGYAPHQDAAAYRFADHHVSVMVPLDPSTRESGCLDFAPGHSQGRLETDGRGRIADETARRLAWRPVEAMPGDLLFFDSYTPHRSGSNFSGRARRALYLTYNAASLGDLRDRYYADKQAELEREGATFSGERVRISVSDDFLGRPVEVPRGRRSGG